MDDTQYASTVTEPCTQTSPQPKYEYIVLDIEGSAKPKMHPWDKDSYISSVGVLTPDGVEEHYFFNPLIGDYDSHINQLNWFIKNTKLVVGHNILFDLTWLDWLGLRNPDLVYCTMNNEYLLRGQIFKDGDGFLSLNNLAKAYVVPTKLDIMEEYWNNGVETYDIPVSIHTEYNSQDLKTTEALYLKQRDKVLEAGLDKVSYLMHQMTRALTRAINIGAPFNKNVAEHIINTTMQQIDEYETQVKDILNLPDLKLNSPKQFAAAIYGGTIQTDGREYYMVTLKDGTVKERSRKAKIPVTLPGIGWTTPFTTLKGNDSVGKDAIKMLKASTPIQKQVLPLLLERASLTGRITTLCGTKGDVGWINNLGTDGRLHGGFTQTFTYTGRLNCKNPNLLNIPRGKTSPLKTVFDPGKGKVIINADLAQIEWRAAAQLSGCPTMCQELVDGTDIHTLNAINILESKYEPGSVEFKTIDRQIAKVVSFRLLYGGSAMGFFNDPQMPEYSKKKWEKIVEGFLEKYSGLSSWWSRVAQVCMDQGFYRLPSGRVIPSPKVDLSDEKSKGAWFRYLKNYPVQAFSADIMMLVLDEFLKRKPNYFLQKEVLIFLFVYDSLVFECDINKAQEVIEIMLDIFDNLTTILGQFFNLQMLVPFTGDVEVGHTYATTSKVTRDDYKETLTKLKLEQEQMLYVD